MRYVLACEKGIGYESTTSYNDIPSWVRLFRQEVDGIIVSLEALAPAFEPDLLSGGWELIYSSVEPFRSSPFFW